MFTGIVEATADILENASGRLVVARPRDFADLRIGSSIAVSGVCLSVVTLSDTAMTFDVVPETLACTTLGALIIGDRVNLERAMNVDARFEGHVVQGHVEAVGEAVSCQLSAGSAALVIRVPQHLLPLIVPKGSIALDGVSLTVASIERDRMTVALIPHTLAQTTFGSLKEGDRVNIETDIMGRYLWHFIEQDNEQRETSH